jgi:hypothetical protein
MKLSRIIEAERVAERFLEAVQAHHDRYGSDDDYRKFCEYTGYRETAAMRRASMDLTRALADMRKP